MDALAIITAACAAVGLRPCYRGELSLCTVLVDVDGRRVRVAATDAPLPAFAPAHFTDDAPVHARRVIGVHAELFAYENGGR